MEGWWRVGHGDWKGMGWILTYLLDCISDSCLALRFYGILTADFSGQTYYMTSRRFSKLRKSSNCIRNVSVDCGIL